MDDLLALLDDASEAEIRNDNNGNSGHQPNDEVVAPSSSTVTCLEAETSRRNPFQPQRQSLSQAQHAEASIDARLDIRMTKRQVGSIALMDMLAENDYRSPAALVSMKDESLRELLLESSGSELSGKTNIMTLGIVFTNSGTKITRAGRAFSIIQIGNLQTGPVLSVFLFGDAYSRHCRDCVAGQVVGVLHPTFLPPKEANASISLSVRDATQILLIATARDYGICKGVAHTRQADPGQGVREHRCKQYVDTRKGQFCKRHSKQANVRNGSTGKDMTFRQQFLKEFSRPSYTQQLEAQMLPIANAAVPQPPGHNGNPLLSNVPKQMVQGQRTACKEFSSQQAETSARQTHQSSSSTTANPYKRTAPTTSGSKTKHAAVHEKKPTQVKGDWLQHQTGNNKAKKKRAVNTVGCSGIDGSVVVPAASKVLFTNSATVTSVSASIRSSAPAEDRAQEVIERQKRLGLTLKDSTNHQPSLKHHQPFKKKEARQSSDSDFFASLQDIDLDAARNAKSRFEHEASAESYARSRRNVTELEQREDREKEHKKKKKNTQSNKIHREWHCITCKQFFHQDPVQCKRQGHTIKLKRNIEETKTLTEQRLSLADKSVEAGGLKLGAGIEWTKITPKC